MTTYKEPYLPHNPVALDNMHTTIDANNQTLLRQAPMTADEYLHSAIDHIDERLGKGYAKAYPELIAAFMQTSAIDLGTAVIARAIESIGAVADAIRGLDESLRSDHPLQSQTFEGLEDALEHIATAISENRKPEQ